MAIPIVLWIDNMLSESLDDPSPGEACRVIISRKTAERLAVVAGFGCGLAERRRTCWTYPCPTLLVLWQETHHSCFMTMSSDLPNGRARPRPPGRPRRLTTEQVLKAGLELGLEGLTMSAVAERLGVSITVLYGYVSSRDELLRLAASYASERHGYPKDVGQHWALYVAQNAVALFNLFTGPSQLLGQFLGGGLGPEIEIDRAEVWLEALVGRGFAADEAFLLQRQMGEIVIGGAATVLRKRALAAAGVDFEGAARHGMTVRDSAQIPLLLSQKAAFAAREPVWPRTLVQLLTVVAQQRGESLDSAALLCALGAASPH